MHPCRLPIYLTLFSALCFARSIFADEPVLPGIGAAMQEMVAKNEIVGAGVVEHRICTSSRAGKATTTSCPCSPTRASFPKRSIYIVCEMLDL